MTARTPAPAEAPLVLALDVGSSSVRARAFDGRGGPVSGLQSSREYAIETGPHGGAELDADVLLERTFECVDEALAQAPPGGPPFAAVAVSSFVGSVVGVDASGRAVTPLVLYADTRAAAEVARLRSRLDEPAFHQRTGCRFHTSYLPAQFLWMARERRQWLEQSRQWLPLDAYLALRLFGDARVSYSVASWSGLLDRTALRWDEPLLELLPIEPSQLPPLCDVDEARPALRPPYDARWPALRGARWFPAVGDGAAANVGSGCVDATRMAVTIGTSSAARVVVPDFRERLPPGLWCYRVDRRRSLLGGALNEGGNLFAWAQETLRLDEGPGLEAALLAAPPAAHGLAFLPLLAGERSTGWEPAMRAGLVGLSLRTTPLDILRAALEGVALRIGMVHDQVRSVLPQDLEVVASGGALLRSPAWQHILADVLARPVTASSADQASARGAALLALEALGQGRLEDFAVAATDVIQPDAARHQAYLEPMRRQQALYDHLLQELSAEGPEAQLWTVEEPDRSRIAQGVQWAATTPAKETDIDALVGRRPGAARARRGRKR
jgi:gluconokinase